MKFTFQDYVNSIYGTEVDLCDLDESDYTTLYEEWINEESKKEER